jgi:hypothetical protein
VLYYGADGRGRTEVPAKSLGGGVYEADVKINRFVTYYVFVGSQSEKVGYSDLPNFSLLAVKPEPGEQQPTPQAAAEGGS